MIKLKFFAAFASLAMVACAPVVSDPIASTPRASPGDASCGIASGTLMDERALYTAETAYNVPANAYVTLDSQGQLSEPTKERIRPLLVKSYDALKLARAAYQAGSACNFIDAVRNVSLFANQAKAILPRAN